MDYFGINSADDLPKIKEVLADQIVEPTRIHHTDFEQSESLLVSEQGELVDVENATENEEEHVNGHSFDVQAHDTGNDPGPEDPSTEEATEEYIADETFIEGDEIEDGGAGAHTHGHHDTERGQLRVVLGGKEEQAV